MSVSLSLSLSLSLSFDLVKNFNVNIECSVHKNVTSTSDVVNVGSVDSTVKLQWSFFV